jgi:hypothetical protein
MPRGQGFTTKRVSTSGSRGVVIHHLGRRQRSPSESDERSVRRHFTPGVYRISNARLPLQRNLDNEHRRAEIDGKSFSISTATYLPALLALPAQTRRAAVRVALDTGHTVGINEQMITDVDAWEDVPLSLPLPDHETPVDPSHEGGEYFQFVDMAQDAFHRYVSLLP